MPLTDLLNLYRTTLFDDVMPFWMKHGLDPAGGINSCIADDGTVVSRDKWSWSQWRAVWVFSKLYNRFGQDPKWLDVALNIYELLTRAGTVEGDHWPLLVSHDGKIIRGYESLYVDSFALCGLTELARATERAEVLDQAMKTFAVTRSCLQAEQQVPAWPYTRPPGRLIHGMSMVFSIFYHELALVSNDSAVRTAADNHHYRVMETFLRPDRGLILEALHPDGSELDPPEGLVVLPGHAIESLWFQMHIAREAGDTATLDKACEAVRRHLEIGWDPEFGGILLAVNADGKGEIAWPYADTKLWWPHTEALYATLLAYEHCKQDWCLDWHEKIRAYSYDHYPVKEHGEWTQKLDRKGQLITDVVALPVKDPFHLPRALIYCVDVLERLTAR